MTTDFGYFAVQYLTDWHQSESRFVAGQSPVMIYDSRADIAIRSLGGRLGTASQPAYYRAYCDEWRCRFEEHVPAISSGCTDCASAATFSPPEGMTRSEAKSLMDSRWFHERVFDYWLWEIADAKPAKTG